MGGLTVDDLFAREEIGDVVKDLARGTDRLDAELMASCYHPDGTDDHNVFRGTGTEFAQWVVDTLPHFAGDDALHRPAPDPDVRRDGDRAQVDTYCVAHHVSRSPTTTGSRPTWCSGSATSTASSGGRGRGGSRPGCAPSTGRTPCRSIPREDSRSRRGGRSAPATGPTSPTRTSAFTLQED